jgi:exonuclease III
VSNQITEQIAYDTTVLMQKESFENSGYTPLYTGSQTKTYSGLGNLRKTEYKNSITKNFSVQLSSAESKRRPSNMSTSSSDIEIPTPAYEQFKGVKKFLKSNKGGLFEIPFEHPSYTVNNYFSPGHDFSSARHDIPVTNTINN